MSTVDNRLEVDSVDFQIACRRFTIKATVTRDKQLPVVDEFVLRLLAVIERFPIARMRAWFGFSEAEMQTVLIDMTRRRLIEFDGDEVSLAPGGRELFRAVGEMGVPQVVEVAPLIADVWFDLVSRNMVPRSNLRNADYLVKINEQQNARDLPAIFAREAFEENFRDYATRIRRFADPQAVNLYSISAVEAGIYSYQILPATLVLDLERMTVRPIITGFDNATYIHKLSVAANEAWQSTAAPDSAPSTASEFERMTGNGALAQVIKSPESAATWLEVMKGFNFDNPIFHPTLGAPYLKKNLEKLLEIVSKRTDLPPSVELTWLRPSGSTWARTVQVAESLNQIRERLRGTGRVEVTTSLTMPRSTPKMNRANHKRLFDRGFLLPQGFLPANLEIFLITGLAAFINVHVPVGNHAVPIGGIVTDQKQLTRLAERLQLRDSSGWEEMWAPSLTPARGV